MTNYNHYPQRPNVLVRVGAIGGLVLAVTGVGLKLLTDRLGAGADQPNTVPTGRTYSNPANSSRREVLTDPADSAYWLVLTANPGTPLGMFDSAAIYTPGADSGVQVAVPPLSVLGTRPLIVGGGIAPKGVNQPGTPQVMDLIWQNPFGRGTAVEELAAGPGGQVARVDSDTTLAPGNYASDPGTWQRQGDTVAYSVPPVKGGPNEPPVMQVGGNIANTLDSGSSGSK